MSDGATYTVIYVYKYYIYNRVRLGTTVLHPSYGILGVTILK